MSVDSRRIACGTAKLLTSNSSYSNTSSNSSKKKRPLNNFQQISSTQQNLFVATVPEPKYMREMTTAIMRVAAFHLICWLPFCLIQLIPTQLLESVLPNLGFDTLKWRTTFSFRIFGSVEDNENTVSLEQLTSVWLAFGANWLSYANSAGNWVLYAALNRDLRSIIKACSERRQKRNTIPQQQIQQQNSQAPHSSGCGSIRIKCSSGRCNRNNLNNISGGGRNAFQVFRFFYSLNSHRSSASIEADGNSTATILPGTQNCICICGNNAQQHLLSNNDNNKKQLCSPKNSNSLLLLRAGTSCSALALCCAECNCNCGGPTIRKHSAQSAISNLFFGGGEKTSITTTLSSASTLATARRSPQTNNLSTGEFGWRDGRAHTFCAPIRAIPPTPNKIPTKTSTTAHLRVAQQLIAATVHGGDLNNLSEGTENQGPTTNTRQGRRESAAEKRELLRKCVETKTQTPIHQIKIII
uniref:G_PROTEIN_RECEP_F1_2 domain-containing protein n=1 Tax=Meloidogyne hapla TaxID=6305 RepID=A0A1I8AYA5_MELHA